MKPLRLPARLALCLLVLAPTSWAQTPDADGFVPLFNGRDLEGWTVENSTSNNFTVRDGVLRVEGPNGWLRSLAQYADFSARVEVRFLTSDADSGFFFRAPDPVSNTFARGWPANAYQVQMRDMSVNRTTNPFWVANLYRHRVPPGEARYDADAALEAVRPTGQWQLFEIDVRGDRVAARLNGVAVLEASGLVNPSGHIGIQGETGVLEYRRIDVRRIEP